jgi:hypothetical protein
MALVVVRSHGIRQQARRTHTAQAAAVNAIA